MDLFIWVLEEKPNGNFCSLDLSRMKPVTGVTHVDEALSLNKITSGTARFLDLMYKKTGCIHETGTET